MVRNCPTFFFEFPAQLIPHLHRNKSVQHAYSVELPNLPTLPTHSISHVPLEKTYNEIQNVSNSKIVEAMEENEVSCRLHQQIILKAQEIYLATEHVGLGSTTCWVVLYSFHD